MELKSFSVENGFPNNAGQIALAQKLAQWCNDSFFPNHSINALAYMKNGYPFVSVGFFQPETTTEERPIDNRLYKEAGKRRVPYKTLIKAFREACDIVWSNPRYVVSPSQRDGKWNEMLLHWINSTEDEIFSVDLDHFYFPVTRPAPWPEPNDFPYFGWFLNFRLGNPLVDQRLFTVFLRRRSRIYGRSDRPAWRKIHEDLVAGRKFLRNKEKLRKDPNGKKFGKKGTGTWKEGIRNAAQRIVVDAAKSAVRSATQKLIDDCAKKAGVKIKKRTFNTLKELLRKR